MPTKAEQIRQFADSVGATVVDLKLQRPPKDFAQGLLRIEATMKHIVSQGTGTIFEVDESKSIHDMQMACPRFFTTKHGKRETYTKHRGCLIVRNTKQFTGCRPIRDTTVYIFTKLENRPDMFCVSAGTALPNVRWAKKLIDKLLDEGVYYYGIQP